MDARYLLDIDAGPIWMGENAVALKAAASGTCHVLSLREWIILAHSRHRLDAGAVADASTRSLHDTTGLAEQLEVLRRLPRRLARTIAFLSPALRHRRGSVLPVSGDEAAEVIRLGVAKGLLAPARADASPAERPQECRLNVITGGRAVAVVRLLAVLADQARRAGVVVRCRVFDNGVDAATSATIVAACYTAATDHLNVDYVGAARVARFAQRCIDAGCDQEAINFGLRGTEWPRIGANKNAALLHGIGAPGLFIDDDVVPRVWTAWGARRGCVISPDPDPREYDFTPSSKGLYRRLIERQGAIWDSHARTLGARVGDLVAEQGLLLDGVSIADAATGLTVGNNDRVRATINGALGHSGMGWHRRLLTLRGPSWQALVKSRASYEHVRATGQMRRVSSALTLSRNGSAPVGGMGLDLQRLMPPFIPSYRGEDILVLDTLRAIDRRAVVGFLPEILEHWPIEPREYSREALTGQVGMRVAQIIAYAQLGLPSLPADGGDALRVLGSALERIGQRPAPAFRRLCQDAWTNHIAHWISETSRTLADNGREPVWWAEDVEALQERLIEAADGGHVDLPADLGLAPSEYAWARLQDYVRMYGRLLQAWPDIWALVSSHPELTSEP